jgi:hypothetical protein
MIGGGGGDKLREKIKPHVAVHGEDSAIATANRRAHGG